MDIGYAVVERFYPNQDYKAMTGMNQIKEIISLDYLLCSSCIQQFSEEDDQYIYRSGDFCDYDIFNHLDFLLSKIDNLDHKQILAVIREPIKAINDMKIPNFIFYGYDLIEDYTRRSVLTNCYGLYDPFFSKDISSFGLIEDYHKAKQIQNWLNKHKDAIYCTLWGVFRMET